MNVVIDQSDIERFRSFIAGYFGLNFDESRLDFLADVLRRGMTAAGCTHFPAYEQRLISSSQDRRAIAEHLTVSETYFFRYGEHFRVFNDVVIPAQIRGRKHLRQLRILSAGCASGEEAYSLAILIRERLPELAGWTISIQAIDISAAVVDKALRGRYNHWSLRDTPPPLRTTYFRAEGREFELVKDVTPMVSFEVRNLVEDDPGFWRPDAFDVVFCRNVIMYFTLEAGVSVINRIARSLTPGGFLFLGHAETLRGISHEFHLRHTHETFYYQLREAGEERASFEQPLYTPGPPAAQLAPPVAVLPDPANSWVSVIQNASARIAKLTHPDGNGSRQRPPKPANSISHQHHAVTDRAAAIELLRQERFAEAIDLLHGLPESRRNDPDLQLLLGVLLTNRGDLAEAEKICRRLLELDDLNAGAHYLMALCREHAGDQIGALEHDQAAIYLDPQFAMPRLHLGLAAKRRTDMETARREFSRALSLLAREDASRVLLFGGGFTREALVEFCRAELNSCGGPL